MVKLYLVLAIAANMAITGESIFLSLFSKAMNKVMGVHDHGENYQGSGTGDKNDNPEQQQKTKTVLIQMPHTLPGHSPVNPPQSHYPPAPVYGYPLTTHYPPVIVQPVQHLPLPAPVYLPVPALKPMPVYEPVPVNKPMPSIPPKPEPQPNPTPSYRPAPRPLPSLPCKDNSEFY